MMKVYVRDGHVVSTSWAANNQVTVTPAAELIEGALLFTVPTEHPVEPGWSCTMDGLAPVFNAPTPLPPTVGPNQFYFLWTMEEQLAIEELRESDPVVRLFLKRLDDPRTTEVVLADLAVQGAIMHTIDALATKGLIAVADKAKRFAAIINGGRE